MGKYFLLIFIFIFGFNSKAAYIGEIYYDYEAKGNYLFLTKEILTLIDNSKLNSNEKEVLKKYIDMDLWSLDEINEQRLEDTMYSLRKENGPSKQLEFYKKLENAYQENLVTYGSKSFLACRDENNNITFYDRRVINGCPRYELEYLWEDIDQLARESGASQLSEFEIMKIGIVNLTDFELCDMNTDIDGTWIVWKNDRELKDSVGIYKAEELYEFNIQEMKDRELSLQDCQKLTRRYSAEDRSRMAMIDECRDIGFQEGTPEMGNCVLELKKLEVEREAKNEELRIQRQMVREIEAENDRVEKERKRQRRVDGWNQIMQGLSGLADIYGTPSSSSSSSIKTKNSEPRKILDCFLSSEYVSGGKKFCVYNCGGREHIETAPGFYSESFAESANCPHGKYSYR